MPKFDCSWSGGTQRSSVNQTSTPDQSSRMAAARSYAARGVDPPVSATWPLTPREQLGGRLSGVVGDADVGVHRSSASPQASAPA